MDIHAKLVMAVTEYDRKESTKRHYNAYALGQYLGRIQEIDADIAAGANVRAAICAGFTGRLLAVCLKAIGEPKPTDEELRGKSLYYRPTV